MNKQNPFFTLKICRWSYSLLSAGILLLSVSHPVVAQIFDDDYYREKRKSEEHDEWFWHNDRMWRQQQPVRSVQEGAKGCSDGMSRELYKAQAYNLLGIISAYCTAISRDDFNTAWINIKRVAAIYHANNYFSEAEVKEFLDLVAVGFINNMGWTPPEYR